MTALERNGDIVRLASYAPLLGKQRHMQWTPDLIYFDNSAITPSINYYVQQLFGQNAGDVYLPSAVSLVGAAETLALSCVRDTASGDVVLKLVSRADAPLQAQIDLSALAALEPEATCTVLTGDPLAENAFGRPAAVLPKTSPIAVAPRFTYDVPAHSLSVIRIRTRASG